MSELIVLIVEDDPIIAEDLYRMCRKLDYAPIEPCYTIDEAVSILKLNPKPDIVLLDINFEGKAEGFVLAQKLITQFMLPYVFVTSYSDKSTVKDAGMLQPYGYIVKPFSMATVYSTIQIAMANFAQRQNLQYPKIQLDVINKKLLNPITEREFDVINLINEGKGNQEISELLYVSINTTKKHLKNIFEKLEVGSRSELMALLRKKMIN